MKREYSKEYYHSHKEECSQYNKERRKWLKEHGICVACGSENAVKGKTYCYQCLANLRDSQYTYRLNNKEKIKEHYQKNKGELINKAKERYRKRKESCLCISCGKPVKDKHVRCEWCRIKTNKQMRDYRLRKGIIKKTDYSTDICRKCNEPVVPGKKLCEKHLAAQQKVCIAIHNTLKKSRKTHIWRNLDYATFQSQKSSGIELNSKKGGHHG